MTYDEMSNAIEEFLEEHPLNELLENLSYRVSDYERKRERQTGRWIERIDRDNFDDSELVFYQCDQCHGTADETYDFCPNCGADMRGETK